MFKKHRSNIFQLQKYDYKYLQIGSYSYKWEQMSTHDFAFVRSMYFIEKIEKNKK